MTRSLWLGILALGFVSGGFASSVRSEEPETTADSISLEKLVAQVRPAMVTIRVADRNGQVNGLGTGFIIDSAGLVATNWHVIQEGRAFSLERWPKHPMKVVAIEASDRQADLALIRVDPEGMELPALKIATTPDPLSQGRSIAAFGNPLGLEQSVVRGVVSAVREMEGQPMLQLAMPIEQGNSGGPIVDGDGVVHGIVNMKSAVDENLGFAIPIQRLRDLMARPNPVAIDRWVRLSGIDPDAWTPLFGASWRQASGRISVSGMGSGFGGRALCLSTTEPPEMPYELSVDVKLDDESGAAGLAFHSDGGDRHYGFYPSNGQLRLTCFRGPDVYSWQVLHDQPSEAYQQERWNRLKVIVDRSMIRCFVNDQPVFVSRDTTLSQGRVGLAKFRNTQAEFRRFYVGPPRVDEALSAANQQWFERISREPGMAEQLDAETLSQLATQETAALRILEERAMAAERTARQLRKRSEEVRLASILKALREVMREEGGDSLVRGALLIAQLDHPDLVVEEYLSKLQRMADEIRLSIKEPKDGVEKDGEPAQTLTPAEPTWIDESQRILALDRYLFQENGFHGGRQEYYHPANSHLNRVIDDREGLPITLAIVYMDLGRRLGLHIEGIGLPGHFVARFVPSEGEPQLIDVFEQAARMPRSQAAQWVIASLGRMIEDEDLVAQNNGQILTRVLNNLIGSAQRLGDDEALWRYCEALAASAPEEPRYRAMRAFTRYQTDRLHGAREDLQWLGDQPESRVDADELERLRMLIDR